MGQAVSPALMLEMRKVKRELQMRGEKRLTVIKLQSLINKTKRWKNETETRSGF